MSTYKNYDYSTRKRIVDVALSGGDWKNMAINNGVKYYTAYNCVYSQKVVPEQHSDKETFENELLRTIYNSNDVLEWNQEGY